MVNLLAPILVCPLVVMAIEYKSMKAKLEEVKRFNETLDVSLLIMCREGMEKNMAEMMEKRMAEMMEKKMTEMVEKLAEEKKLQEEKRLGEKKNLPEIRKLAKERYNSVRRKYGDLLSLARVGPISSVYHVFGELSSSCSTKLH
ncbi:hypothetical protein ABKV19_022098 [Rosa sericea]